jgi:hypothetical protein
MLRDDATGRIVEELWWTNKQFSCIDIIPEGFPMLIHNMRVAATET